jgi:NTE family protein
MWVRGWGGGLLSGTRLGALIDEFLPAATFEALRVPVVVLATDVDTGEGVVFREGSLRDAVRASCSFPGFFPPFAWNGRRLVDGGVTEVVPVRLAREMAGENGLVLAIDCNAGGRWPAADSFVAIALRAGLTVVRGRTRSELVGADLVIAPSIGESGWMRPTRIPSFAAAGEQALLAGLPELRRLLGA